MEMILDQDPTGMLLYPAYRHVDGWRPVFAVHELEPLGYVNNDTGEFKAFADIAQPITGG